MKWNIEKEKLFIIDESKINADESSVYNLIANHFFNNDSNVYIINNDKLKFVVSYENFFNNKFDLQRMFIKDFVFINEDDNDQIIEQKFKNTNFNYLPVIDNNNHLLYELKLNKNSDELRITKSRWDILYKDNDKVAIVLNKYTFKEIYVMGTLKSKLYNYIIINTNFKCFKLDSNRNNFISTIKKDNVLIIDTDNINLDYKKWIYDIQKYNTNISCGKFMSIKELCDYSELINFKNLYNNSNFNCCIFEFQTPETLKKLSFNEKLRISFDKHYRYYYSNLDDSEIYKIVKKVLGKDFTPEFIKSRNEMTGSVLKNGVCYLADSNNEYCKVVNGLRYTANKNGFYKNKINVFGACIVYGAVVNDEDTIPSLLQKKINNYKYNYEVNNYGARAIDFYENIRTADSLNIYKNDVFIFVVSPDERKELEKIGINGIYKFSDVLNSKTTFHDYFMGEPVHCNSKANKVITEYIFDNIKNMLKNNNIQDSNILIKKANINKNKEYIKNPRLMEYLKFLESKKRNTKNNGAVMMNCNPFTYGHLKLIEYASKKVETLYVFIVQEDRSYFKFEDRYKMAVESCKKLPNVVVLESGTIFGTFMTFQAYFEKETNSEIEVDASLDIELFTSYVAPILNISKRFVGAEPVDKVTQQYNRNLMEILPNYDIELFIIPRFEEDGKIISAKTVRKAIEDKNMDLLKKLVPKEVYSIIKNKYIKG